MTNIEVINQKIDGKSLYILSKIFEETNFHTFNWIIDSFYEPIHPIITLNYVYNTKTYNFTLFDQQYSKIGLNYPFGGSKTFVSDKDTEVRIEIKNGYLDGEYTINLQLSCID